MTSLPTSPTLAPRPFLLNPYVLLVVTLMAASFAAPLLRFTLNAGMPPFLISASRLTIATLLYTPIVLLWYRRDLARLSRPALIFSLMSGVFLGAHFMLTPLSLQKTSILINQLFTNIGPIWVAILEMVLLKVRHSRAVWAGIFVAIVGSVIITLGGATGHSGSDLVLGSVLAILGSLTASLYLVAGRRVRQEVSLIPYVWIVFGVGAVTSWVGVLAAGLPLTGYSESAWLWLMVVVIVPQMIGHTGYNYIVGFFSATSISLTNLLIILTSAALAFVFFGETPTITHFIGGAIIMAGIALAVLGKSGDQAVRAWWEKRKR